MMLRQPGPKPEQRTGGSCARSHFFLIFSFSFSLSFHFAVLSTLVKMIDEINLRAGCGEVYTSTGAGIARKTGRVALKSLDKPLLFGAFFLDVSHFALTSPSPSTTTQPSNNDVVESAD